MTTIFKDYPYWPAETERDMKEQLRQICNTRKDDITQINNLISNFVSGRKVAKIPANSGDVDPTDKIGDVSFDNSNMYVLQNPGSPQWIKYTGSAF